LRRYLEQRREMGESELVLDSLTVEEAMRIVAGAREKSDDAPPADDADSADWRETLRAAGGAPSAPRARRALGDQPAREASPRAPQPPPAPAPREPPLSAAAPGAPVVDAPPGLVVGSDARELFGGAFSHVASLEEIAKLVHACQRCPLYRTATHGVPGDGQATSDVMICGEAPGANEDETGRPFVGAAGQLLTKILAAVDLRREDVFITNVLKHRPPGNRNPLPEEVAACSPYLVRQIELIQPKVILALGTFAAQTLLATRLPISKLRGQLHRYHGVPLIVTYHPAALLRNPGWKRPTWEDVQLARRVLDRARGA
jgi:DNA polymerase